MEIDKVYRKYKDSVNMSCGEFKKWSKTQCSKKASINRKPITRNIKLLCTPKKDWTKNYVKEAKKTISFNARMSKSKQGKKVKGCNLSKRDISLKNWALDVKK